MQIKMRQIDLHQVRPGRQFARLLPGMDGLGDSPFALVEVGQRGPGDFAGVQRDGRKVFLFGIGAAPHGVEDVAPKPMHEGAVGKSQKRSVGCRKRLGSAAKSGEQAGGVGRLIERSGGRIIERSGWQSRGCALHRKALNQTFRLWLTTHENCGDLIQVNGTPATTFAKAFELHQLDAIKAPQRKNDGVDVVAVRFLLPSFGIWRELEQLAGLMHSSYSEEGIAAVDIVAALRAEVPGEIAAFVVGVENFSGDRKSTRLNSS